MTAPVQEPTQGRSNQRQDWGTRQLFRRPAPLGQSANYEIKLFADTAPAVVGDGAFFFPIPRDVSNLFLTDAQAGVSTVGGSGTMTVQVHNVSAAVDMLSTEITIDATETTSFTAAVPSVVDVANSQVTVGQTIRIDIDTIPASDGLGLAVMLRFSPAPVV